MVLDDEGPAADDELTSASCGAASLASEAGVGGRDDLVDMDEAGEVSRSIDGIRSTLPFGASGNDVFVMIGTGNGVDGVGDDGGEGVSCFASYGCMTSVIETVRLPWSTTILAAIPFDGGSSGCRKLSFSFSVSFEKSR